MINVLDMPALVRANILESLPCESRLNALLSAKGLGDVDIRNRSEPLASIKDYLKHCHIELSMSVNLISHNGKWFVKDHNFTSHFEKLEPKVAETPSDVYSFPISEFRQFRRHLKEKKIKEYQTKKGQIILRSNHHISLRNKKIFRHKFTKKVK